MSGLFAKTICLFWKDASRICRLRAYSFHAHKLHQIQEGRAIWTVVRNTCSVRFLKLDSVCKFITLPVFSCISFLSKAVIADDNGDIEDNITHLIVLSKIALEKGDLEKAEALLQVGLKICDDYKVSFGLPLIYDILASIALSQGDTEKAEQLLVTAIERLTQNGVSDTNDHIVDFKLRLARIYSVYKENMLAEIGFKTCLDIQKRKIASGDMSTRTGMIYINIMFWYGVHMIKNSHYSEAKKLIDTAYDYSHKIKGLSPYQEMVILYTLADLNMELGEYDMALSKMQTAVMLGKGISSSDLPRCYVKLARIYMKLGVYDQAKSAALEGEKLARMFNNVDTLKEARLLLDEIRLIS